MGKTKSMGIQAKLLGALLSAVIFIVGLIVFLFYKDTSSLVRAKSETILNTNTTSVVNQVSAWMNQTITALELERDTIQYFDMDTQEELEYIRHTQNQYDSFPAGIYLATTQGKLIHGSFVPGADFNVFEKPWYIDGIKSEKFIFGSVYFDEDSKSYVVGASGMLRNHGGNLRGVAAADIYLDAISEIVKPIQLEQTGAVFLVDGRTSTIIGSKDPAFVGTTLSGQEDGMYRSISQKLEAGTLGLYTNRDEKNGNVYIDIEEVPGSDWYTVAYVPEREVVADLNLLATKLIMMAMGLLVVLAAGIVILVRHNIVVPVKKLDHVAQRIADGDLNQRIDYQSNDEFGMLAENFNKTVSKLRDYTMYIDEISNVLGEISDGKLDFTLTHDYTGEFAKVRLALEQISNSLNHTLQQIDNAADQVAEGSGQVAGGAQALSQGATEQASAVEELAATIHEISVQVKGNAGNAQTAKKEATVAEDEIQTSNERMKHMLLAMEDISNASGEIGNILKTIEDISFQTNILALNAAVEAARAGTAGKGFAVVADEVRNLAMKSSEASKNTAQLIENAIAAVDNGKKISDDTARSLNLAAQGARNVSRIIQDISVSSEEQYQSIAQVTLGMEQISSVVQANSATAEESAASSHELSGQAQLLKGLVGRFKLKGRKS